MKFRHATGLFLSAALVLGLTIFSGCDTTGDVVLEDKDDGRAIELKMDQSIVLRLEGNPSTGFTWEVVGMDDSVIKLIGEVDFEPDSDLIGAPGVLTFRFDPVEPGQTDLELVYRRPWEEGVPPLKTYSIRVTVL